jgi:predicted RecA/RadA family phage recombinase
MVGGPTQESEIAPNYYYDPNRKAGEEVSSTFEGRHVYVQEILLIHVDSGDGLVDKGQPVAFWEGVGVALKSAESTSENIPIDTEGIWRLSVVSTAPIMVGQSLFIDMSGVVTDDPTNAQAVIGYALQAIPTPRIAIIAVKVHWMGVPWIWFWWFFFSQF